MTSVNPYLLLVEDDLEDRELLTDIFHRFCPAVEIRYFTDGEQALNFLLRCAADCLPIVILLDYRLPFMTGGQLLSFIRYDQRYENIPKLVWSGSDHREYVKECLDNGAMKYQPKPHSFTEIRDFVSYVSEIIQSRLATSDPS